MVRKKTTGKNKPFTKEDLKTIREELLRKKAEMLEELIKLNGEALNKTLKDASGDLSGYSFHMADMATDLYDREFSLELAEGERERLYALDEALKRIDEGVYGMCDMCGVRISKQRLKVMPQAKYCIKCQEKEEKSAGR
ncbi:MAG: TraR/DksA family transcriptional regulator [Candidatus Omnitrophota bacterium]|nr:TraR/DksA family transcriptional regulator [Candidatus Omnitrophota bacterium]